ncbi:MAG: hypothetical protein ACLPH3_05525 [Terracidiphilus sp.]
MMPDSEKDRAADEVAERRATFDLALSNKRKYPVQEFGAFVQSARRYIAMTKNDPMIHKSVARAVNGLREYLAFERKRIRGMFFLRQTVWSACFLPATIPHLRAMSPRDYE